MKNIYLIVVFLLASVQLFAQKDSSLVVFGYGDAYWKYDFANQENIGTYFANDQNSLSLGMLDVGLKKRTGKAHFVGELAFGPRGQYLSTPNGDGNDADAGNSFHIQNLYASYDFTDKFSMTAGYMSTFIGYEVISPAGNFNYSTSYLFGAGPFQNAGVKATYAFSDKLSLMAGLFDDWNVYHDFNGLSHIGAQLAYSPTESLHTYLNFLSGSSSGGAANYSSGTLVDLVADYDFSPKLSLALNAADYNQRSKGGYQGLALYPQYQLNEHVALGLRAEYYSEKDSDTEQGSAYTAFTLSGQLKHGGLTLIPELRLDHHDQATFLQKDGISPTKQAAQAVIALVFAF